MNKSKKIICGVLVLVCIFSSAFSFDWGGSSNTSFSVYDAATFPTEEATLSLAEKLSLWGKVSFNKNISLNMEGNYQGTYDFEKYNQKIDLQLFDLKMAFIPSTSAIINVYLGRLFVSDSSRMIYGYLIDGGKVQFSLPTVDLGVFAGYTGLINSSNLAVVNSSQEIDFQKIYSLAPAFVAVGLNATAKNVFGNNSFGLDISSFIPTDAKETRETSIYLELNSTGPIANSFYYDLSTAVSFLGSKTGIMANGAITYYPSFLSSMVAANVTFATDTFASFVDPALVLGESNSLSGLLKAGLVASIKPIDSLLVQLAGDFVMDVQGSSLVKDSIQWNTSLKWQAMTDIQLNMFVGQKIPLVDTVEPVWFCSAGFTLNF